MIEKLFKNIQYEGMEPLTAIELGDGSVSIIDVDLDCQGRAGIAFKKQLPSVVGSASGDGGKMLDEVAPNFIIITDNAESLKVLLDKVERAISHLTKQR